MRTGLGVGLCVAGVIAIGLALYGGLHPGLFAAVYSMSVLAILLGARLLPGGTLTARTIAALSVLGFLLILPSSPAYDDDLRRYIWDGRVTLDRGNPYGIAPSDYRLLHLRNDDFSKIGFRDTPTVYPPLAEAVFAAAAATGPAAPYVIKLLLLAAHVWILTLLIRRRIPPVWLALYALNPIVLKEFANSGHIDLIGIAFLTAALFGGFSPAWRFALAAGAVLVKPIALLALVPLFIHLNRRARWIAAGGAVVTIALLWNAGIDDGLQAFARHWTFSPLLFEPLRAIVGETVSRITAAAIPIVVLGGALRKRWDLESTWEWTFLAWLVFSPVVNPWYIAWGIPIFAVRRRLYGAVFTLLAPMSYVYYLSRGPVSWAQHVTVALLFSTLFYEFRLRFRNFSPR